MNKRLTNLAANAKSVAIKIAEVIEIRCSDDYDSMCLAKWLRRNQTATFTDIKDIWYGMLSDGDCYGSDMIDEVDGIIKSAAYLSL